MRWRRSKPAPEKVPFETSVPLEIDDGYSFLDDDSLLFRAGSWLLHWFALVVLTIYNRLFFGLRDRRIPASAVPASEHHHHLQSCQYAGLLHGGLRLL